jgi:hypothetical protein
MYREFLRVPRPGRGRTAAASFCFSSLSNRTVSARSMTAAGSPSGIWCRRRSCAHRSFAWVAASTVTWILYRSGASAPTTAGATVLVDVAVVRVGVSVGIPVGLAACDAS